MDQKYQESLLSLISMQNSLLESQRELIRLLQEQLNARPYAPWWTPPQVDVYGTSGKPYDFKVTNDNTFGANGWRPDAVHSYS